MPRNGLGKTLGKQNGRPNGKQNGKPNGKPNSGRELRAYSSGNFCGLGTEVYVFSSEAWASRET
ncbi:MAG: hypothetical protein IJD43_08140 [Thermoguttaceae bacterium]|nr:hypothetical protein [Thermoguttaceae bacterium]